jgi:polysaccharide biosynthesis transport protein
VTLHQIVLLARRWAWLAVLTVALAAGMGAVAAARQPRVYEATATLLVAPGLPDNPATDVSVQQGAERLTSTYAALITSPPTVAAALQAGGLDLPTEQAVKLVDVRPVRDTQLLQIVVQSDDPDRAAQLANLVAQTFIQQLQTSQTGRFAASEAALRSQVDQLGAALETGTRQLAQAQAQPPGTARDADVARVQSQLTRLQDSYAAALRSVEDVRLAQARSSDLVTLVDAATPPRTPVAPRLLPTEVLAALVGLLIAVAIAVVVERLDDRPSSPERLARLTGLPTQGLLADQPPAAAAESCRLLWARLRFATRDHPLRTLLVTSSAPGDGKTLVAVNLAVAAAESGARVVLVDANFRHPSLHEVFHTRATLGLASLLSDDQRPVAPVLAATPISGLWLLPAGAPPARTGDWLVGRCMRQRLAALQELADLVIVDSPPVVAASDVAVLTALTDGTLLVVDARARAAQVTAAIASLRSADGLLVGAVLNRVPAAGRPAGRGTGWRFRLARAHATAPVQPATRLAARPPHPLQTEAHG